MKISSKKIFGVALAVVLLFGACIETDSRELNPAFEGLEVTAGGTLTVAGAGKLDSLDPALMLSSTTSFLARGIFRTLVAFGSTESGEAGAIVPDLATDTGSPNAELTRWTFELRPGIVFGPSLGGIDVDGVTGRTITSADVKYAIERLFRSSPPAGAAAYFSRIVGADAYADGSADSIAGIVTPNERTIVFELSRPTGDWPYRMALPPAAPVPAAYARSLDLPGGSDYSEHVVATGPYYVDRWIPGERLVMKRNELWDPALDEVRAAFVDEVDWEFGFQGPEDASSRATEKIVGGRFDVVEGAGPGEVLLGSDFKQNVVSASALCTRYVWINPNVPPFDNPQVRKAIAIAIDRARLVELQRGLGPGEVAASVLPPGLPGHLSATDYNPFDSPAMAGDMNRAKEILGRAGVGQQIDDSVLIAGNTQSPEDEYAQSVRSDLRRLGFSNVELKLADAPELFTDFYAQAKDRQIAIGTSSGRCREYLDASSFFEPLVVSWLDDDDVDEKVAGGMDAFGFGALWNKALDRRTGTRLRKALLAAESATPGPERTAAWELVNRIVTESALLIPWAWDGREVLYNRSRLQNPVYNRAYGGLDWTVVGVGERR